MHDKEPNSATPELQDLPLLSMQSWSDEWMDGLDRPLDTLAETGAGGETRAGAWMDDGAAC